jgi:hypothetical protein
VVSYCPLTAEKLQAVSAFGIVPLSAVTGLILGAETPEDVLRGYQAAGAELILA